MPLFRFTTAGESHGPALTAVVEGLPAGLPVAVDSIDAELRRRQGGYGRGGRMRIESDRAEILSGIRHGETLGSPVAMLVRNRDWANWTEAMSAAPVENAGDDEAMRRVFLPRPGHADLVGAMKYGRSDARDILERASARETAARVAAGALAKRLLAELGITVGSHVVSLGGIDAAVPDELPEDLNAASDPSPVRCLDAEAEGRMIDAIDAAKREGDTLGGVFEVVARGVPAGLGSHVSWDRKLDGRLAAAVMSIQAIKGVEIGIGFAGSMRPGSRVHDEIVADASLAVGGGYGRGSNRAGGLEGGITTGQPLVVRGAMKPISTLMRPLGTVDLRTGQPGEAVRERSDVCAVPAAGVVGEAMVALVLAGAVLEKFGGDSLAELRRSYDAYLAQINAHGVRA
ncbi:MAG TPA: chorismate synthase [Longimicrobiaceae bacterium]|jgi:chorismate synthase|nr:chorismate synthase [Longimicrobiaceae bacterium]